MTSEDLFLGAFWGEILKSSLNMRVVKKMLHTFVFGNSCRKITSKSEGIGVYRNQSLLYVFMIHETSNTMFIYLFFCYRILGFPVYDHVFLSI